MIHISNTSLKVQLGIVVKIVILQTKTQKLEIEYHKKIDNLEELRKSIFQNAFGREFTETRLKYDME